MNKLSNQLKRKYNKTAWFYDILDYPWERVYRKWRSELLKEVKGKVLEAGVGTGRNFAYYSASAELTGIDLSPQMLSIAQRRARTAKCNIELKNIDASCMKELADSQYDWLISTFLCCVMPTELQPQAIIEFARVLKPGGKFKILEMIYSQDPKKRAFQQKVAPFVEWVYGARFDRNTLTLLEQNPNIVISQTRFLKDDTYLLIEGTKRY